jgi:hypothetical protein
MTDTIADNPAVARRQLGFLETFDKKYEGFRRELERLERMAGPGAPPAGGWPTEGLERIARSLVGAGAVYSLPTITTWARGFLERLDRIRQGGAAPSLEDFSWLAERIRALMEIEVGLTRAAREVVSPATMPPPEEPAGETRAVARTSSQPLPFIAPPTATEPRDGGQHRRTPTPPSPSSPPPRPSAPPPPRPSAPPPPRPSTPPPRVCTPVPPAPPADATVPVPSRPPPAPFPDRVAPAPVTPAVMIMREPRDERLVSRAWQVLAVVALLALGFSLWFNHRLFASLAEPGPRAPLAVAGRPALHRSEAGSPARLPDPQPPPSADAGETAPAADAGRETDVKLPEGGDGAVERPATDGYRRGERGLQHGEQGTNDDPAREERRQRRKRRLAAEGAAGEPPAAADNPYAD